MSQKFLPEVRSPRLWFVDDDVIGGFLSEGKVTSPAGLRQIALLTGTDPAGAVVTWLEEGP